MKLSLHDAIISSIYHAQDNANIVWKGHWPISATVIVWMSASWPKASLQLRASRSSYLAPECAFFLNGNRMGKNWEWVANLEVNWFEYKYTIRAVPILCKALSPGYKTPGKKQTNKKKNNTLHISKSGQKQAAGSSRTENWRRKEKTLKTSPAMPPKIHPYIF